MIDKILLAHLFQRRGLSDFKYFYECCVKLDQGQKLTELQLRWADEDFFNRINEYIDAIKSFIQSGGQFLFPWDPLYPESFFAMNDAPYCLSYHGHPIWKLKKGLAIVGSRSPTLWTQKWMQQNLGPALQQLQIFTISGAARGVDQLAHVISIRSDTPTVAILPSGIQNCYPTDFKKWFDPIIKGGGAIVSEYSPVERLVKWNFARRNRLISALSEVTLIVQANLRSGTILTAKHAIEQGRPLGVVPSHPTDTTYAGSMYLISEGAYWVLSQHDIVSQFRSEVLYTDSGEALVGTPLVDNGCLEF